MEKLVESKKNEQGDDEEENDGHNTVNNINELRAEGMRDGSDDDDESKEGHQCSSSTCLPVR
jgi:hypothetical protein